MKLDNIVQEIVVFTQRGYLAIGLASKCQC